MEDLGELTGYSFTLEPSEKKDVQIGDVTIHSDEVAICTADMHGKIFVKEVRKA